jgi:hypothetical protein
MLFMNDIRNRGCGGVLHRVDRGRRGGRVIFFRDGLRRSLWERWSFGFIFRLGDWGRRRSHGLSSGRDILEDFDVI